MVRSSRLDWSGYVLGFSLGGFFDGILLHQVLQWHHLLINVEGEAFRDIRVQILADGLFHLLMYLVAVTGLYMLWRARAELAGAATGRALFACVLIGFGIWNVIDIASAHWLLNIHRVRVDTPNPMAYDLGWFAAFGIVPIAIGWVLKRGSPGAAASRGVAAALLLAVSVACAGALAMMPPRDASQVVAYFGPSSTPGDVMAAAAAADARILWSDSSSQVWAFALPPGGRAWDFYRHGAIVVSNSIGAGCMSWLRAS
jgi:uncharacterized membrane protein